MGGGLIKFSCFGFRYILCDLHAIKRMNLPLPILSTPLAFNHHGEEGPNGNNGKFVWHMGWRTREARKLVKQRKQVLMYYECDML